MNSVNLMSVKVMHNCTNSFIYINKTESVEQFFRLDTLDTHMSKVVGTYSENSRPASVTGVGFGLIGT